LGTPLNKHKPEEIIGKLREAEILLALGSSPAEACRRIEVSEQTFGSSHAPGMAALPQYRWRK
jgi:putative transposase